MTRIAYRKMGTCRILIVFDGYTNVKASDSPRYNDGKKRVLVQCFLPNPPPMSCFQQIVEHSRLVLGATILQRGRLHFPSKRGEQ
jgi:hypothetical protein